MATTDSPSLDGAPPTTTPPPAPAAATKPEPPPAPDVDSLLADLSKMPLFMSELPSSSEDDPSGSLEALKALAYEGTRAEVAENFKAQGNECVKSRKWGDGKEFYTKGLAVLRKEVEGFKGDLEEELLAKGGDEGESRVVDLDEEEERERKLEETLCVNRALCNLELQNNRQVTLDTAAALRLNPQNTKALYRSALALYRLDRLPEATDALLRAATLAPSDAAIATLKPKIEARKSFLEKQQHERDARTARANLEKQALAMALKARNVTMLGRPDAVADMQDARITLENPSDPASVLSYPVLMLYPTAAQSELLKAIGETETLGLWLDEMLPAPWDSAREFADKSGVECYMETVSGGMVKVGKKVMLAEILGKGKVGVRDGIVSVNVVPKGRVQGWIEEVKRRKGR